MRCVAFRLKRAERKTRHALTQACALHGASARQTSCLAGSHKACLPTHPCAGVKYFFLINDNGVDNFSSIQEKLSTPILLFGKIILRTSLNTVAPSAPERMPATASDEGADTMSATQSPPGRASENYSTKKRAAWRSNRSLT